MEPVENFLLLDDASLLGGCDVHVYRASGPGGQHRNKVSSAVRLRHRVTGITAQAAESRSQHTNRRVALRRLRMNIACRRRHPVDLADPPVPDVVTGCLSASRLDVGRKDARFWPVAAFLLDVLDAAGGQLAPAARAVGISTANLVRVLRSERHLLAAAQGVRKQHGRKGIK